MLETLEGQVTVKRNLDEVFAVVEVVLLVGAGLDVDVGSFGEYASGFACFGARALDDVALSVFGTVMRNRAPCFVVRRSILETCSIWWTPYWSEIERRYVIETAARAVIENVVDGDVMIVDDRQRNRYGSAPESWSPQQGGLKGLATNRLRAVDLKKFLALTYRTALDGRNSFCGKRQNSSELVLSAASGRGIQALKDLTIVASRLVIIRVNADT
ncbi:hypothetical protein BASA81_011238 [Batrachochytrium salamandrivorans]|nr:hypothetical protein BASA81_011238 [Batrachochytrium salamandrivorans]